MQQDSNTNRDSFNETMVKFGAPATILHHYEHWLVQLRPAQVTLGSLVLVARGTADTFSALTPAAFTELAKVSKDIESVLKKNFAYDKLNYLMLMMVDNDVHFHVIPRYANTKQFAELAFTDPGWPGPPDLAAVNAVEATLLAHLTQTLKETWQKQI